MLLVGAIFLRAPRATLPMPSGILLVRRRPGGAVIFKHNRRLPSLGMDLGSPLRVELSTASKDRPKRPAGGPRDGPIGLTRFASMAVSDLPRHIVDRFERRWAQKLEAQARNWKSAKPGQTLTVRSMPVVVRRRQLPKSGKQPAA
jgi:hypothetical protein